MAEILVFGALVHDTLLSAVTNTLHILDVGNFFRGLLVFLHEMQRTRWVGVWKQERPKKNNIQQDSETLTLLPSGQAILEGRKQMVRG
jgi:hypothetical protein